MTVNNANWISCLASLISDADKYLLEPLCDIYNKGGSVTGLLVPPAITAACGNEAPALKVACACLTTEAPISARDDSIPPTFFSALLKSRAARLVRKAIAPGSGHSIYFYHDGHRYINTPFGPKQISKRDEDDSETESTLEARRDDGRSFLRNGHRYVNTLYGPKQISKRHEDDGEAESFLAARRYDGRSFLRNGHRYVNTLYGPKQIDKRDDEELVADSEIDSVPGAEDAANFKEFAKTAVHTHTWADGAVETHAPHADSR